MNEPPPPELRRDPISGQTVLIAPGRAIRPMTLAHAEPHHRPPRHRAAEGVFCPFCPGSEWDTPDESYAIREAGTLPNMPGWSIRVVPNKFPAVTPHGGAFGFHDVVVPCPAHEPNPAKLTVDQLTALLVAVRERFRTFSADERIRYAQFFMNVGAEAGASLDHVHGQILATDFVPDAIQIIMAEQKAYEWNHGECEMCSRLTQPERLVYASDEAFVVCPYASRFAYELAVAPVGHLATYQDATEGELTGVANVLKRTLHALDAVLHEPAYNLILHTAPLGDTSESYHWHLSIIPRTARAAGYEWATGVFINTIPPESAALRLREAMAR